MRGRIINPWDSPPGPSTSHRLVHITNLPPNCRWDSISPYITPANSIELHHLFARDALIQFSNSRLARHFISTYNNRLSIAGYPLTISLSPIPNLLSPSDQPGRISSPPSRVICIQVIKLRIYLGIHDIFEECSHFGTVERIICRPFKCVYSIQKTKI
jgi:hypothetical protein